VKLINDLYADDIDIININFDTIKKISSTIWLLIIDLKIGREFLLDKKLIPNLLKNIAVAALHKDVKTVIIGFSVVDNLSRSENGKEELKKNNAINHISKILDNFENDDKVLQVSFIIITFFYLRWDPKFTPKLQKRKTCLMKSRSSKSFMRKRIIPTVIY